MRDTMDGHAVVIGAEPRIVVQDAHAVTGRPLRGGLTGQTHRCSRTRPRSSIGV